MSGEDSPVLSRKTWARTIEPITKIGYMDGASDAQASVYQKSFDVGYEQGFNFGLQLGLTEATICNKQKEIMTNILMDPRKINCQICLNEVKSQENIGNLYNIQKEKNLELLETQQTLYNSMTQN
ncbi:unnamed protein product [Arctia plantaginis]|uniref:Essential protein Yae1 N-terminal domain-containing protein n=1 Tax=Arctia plantaginis TaxID=874455 RepID=A0A8S1AKE4_ARCPL|nr:unnamed protein product [Arctia plantaginis]